MHVLCFFGTIKTKPLVAAYSCVYLNPFLKRIFSRLCHVKPFSAKINTVFCSGFFRLYKALLRLLSHFASHQNKSFFRPNCRQAKLIPWCINCLCLAVLELDLQLSVLIFISVLFPADDTDTVIHHDSPFYPFHLCLFKKKSIYFWGDGRWWVSQA